MNTAYFGLYTPWTHSKGIGWIDEFDIIIGNELKYWHWVSIVTTGAQWQKIFSAASNKLVETSLWNWKHSNSLTNYFYQRCLKKNPAPMKVSLSAHTHTKINTELWCSHSGFIICVLQKQFILLLSTSVSYKIHVVWCDIYT